MTRQTWRALYRDAMRNSGPGGVVTTHVSNRIGSVITAVAMRLGMHPSIISLGNVAAAAVASVTLVVSADGAHPGWIPGWIALVMWSLAYAFDCADGALARATGRRSEFGARVDVLSDYVAQSFIVAAIVTVAVRTSGASTPLVAVICSLWFFGTFAAVLRSSDVEQAHSIVTRRRLGDALRSLMDTGFVNLLLGAWMVASPTSIVLPAVVFTVLNAAYLVASLTRETRLSLRAPRVDGSDRGWSADP